MTESARPPGSADTFGATFLFSLLLHGVLVLGIGFAIAKPRPSLPTLDVTLVNTANRQAPHKADFLAQANNRGGGNSRHAHRPSQPFSSPLPQPDPGQAPQPLAPSARAPSDPTGPQLVTTTGDSPRQVRSQPERRQQPDSKLPRSDVDVRLQQETARLAASVRAQRQDYAKRPHKKWISANTREYAYAAYMRAWTARVEQVGTLNFPDAARTGQLGGDLILTVGLDRSGHVTEIKVIQSSGRKVLDDAAMRIVRLAAPFPPIPRTGEHVSELYITRTYEFERSGTLRAH